MLCRTGGRKAISKLANVTYEVTANRREPGMWRAVAVDPGGVWQVERA